MVFYSFLFPKYSWCDIEGILYESLIKKKSNEPVYSFVSEPFLTYKKLSFYKDESEFKDLYKLQLYVLWKILERSTTKEITERNFDEVLFKKICEISEFCGIDLLTKIEKAAKENNFDQKRINLISKMAKLLQIDSFDIATLNYTSDFGGFNTIHLHGSAYDSKNKPIFGIGGQTVPFSKYSQYKERNLFKNSFLDNHFYKNIVFYGASLSKTDYETFKNLFKKIKLDDDFKIYLFYSNFQKTYEEYVTYVNDIFDQEKFNLFLKSKSNLRYSQNEYLEHFNYYKNRFIKKKNFEFISGIKNGEGYSNKTELNSYNYDETKNNFRNFLKFFEEQSGIFIDMDKQVKILEIK